MGNVVILVALLAAIAILVMLLRPAPAPGIRFAGYGEPYQQKPDFALVEHKLPLRRADLRKLSPKDVKSFRQEQLDQLYARLTAGPIPDGPFDGEALRPDDAPMDRVVETVGGLKGLALKFKRAKLGILMSTLWKGKVFYRDERILRNRIDDLEILKSLAQDDLKDVPKVTVKGKKTSLLFPAKIYCGQSLLDGRRESIIVDYAFTDEIPGYREMPDFLAGRKGFKVRDEIRMLRPGFYLGRAYLSRFFVLNFILYNEEVAQQNAESFVSGKLKEDCWTGTQTAASVS
ncbi:MAG: hypothetical protein ACREQW_15290 [Candidatus Binatia bacterium]